MLVLLIWIQSILLTYVRAVIMRIPLIGAYTDLIIVIVYIFLFILAFKEIKFSYKDIIFYIAVAFVFLLEVLLYKDGAEYLERYLVDFVLKIMPLYFVGVSLGCSEDRDMIIEHMYIASMATIIVGILYQFFFATPMDAVTSQYVGDMDFAYKLLPHCCLVAYHAVKKSNLINVALAVIAGIFLLLLGTRGAAFIYLVCIALCYIFSGSTRKAIIKVCAIFGSLIVFLASPLYLVLVKYLYNLAESVGLSVRIFDKMLNGAFLLSSGRNVIRDKLFVVISEKPILGNGICSDRVFVGGYAHNIAIELWVEFGVIIGTIILGACVIILLNGYITSDSDISRGLIISLVCACFMKLFLSGTYLDERLLLFLIGMCIASIRKKKMYKSRRKSDSDNLNTVTKRYQ